MDITTKGTSWTKNFMPLEINGTKVYCSPHQRQCKKITEILPPFPYKNHNHGLGSPLLALLGDTSAYKI